MGSGKGGGGKLPDYEKLIKDQAYYNRNTQIGPMGGMFWSPDRTTATQVNSPQAQAQLDLRNTLAQYAMGQMGSGFLGITPDMMNYGLQGSNMLAGGGGGGAGGGAGAGRDAEILGGSNYKGPMGGGGGSGRPDMSLMPDAWGNRIDPTGFLGEGPFSGLGFDPEGEEFLKGMLGAGAGGGFSIGGGGGGGGMSLSGLAPLVQFDENGNPNIGPGMMSELNLGSLPELASQGDLMGARNRAEDAAFERAMGLINPEWEKRGAAMQDELANRGIRGGKIANEKQRDFDLGLNQAMSMAALDAVEGGRQEYSFLSGESRQDRNLTLQERLTQANLQNQVQESMAGINLGAYGAEANARYQQGQLGEMAAARGQAGRQANLMAQLQAASALWQRDMAEYQTGFGNLAMLAGFGGNQGLNYSLGSPVDAVGASGAAANNAQFAAANNPWNVGADLVGSLGSAFLMSDSELKTNVSPFDDDVLKKIEDLPIYKWNYRAEPESSKSHIGPMAQDFNAAFDTPGSVGSLEVIDAVSANGVLLAALKALTARVKELETRVES